MRQNGHACRQAGFTVVELLIVIAVIGVLTAIVVLAINPLGKIKQARDATRKIELKQITNALEAFITGTGYYPPFDTPPEVGPTGWACVKQNNMSRLIISSGIKKIPTDPTNGDTCPCYLYALDGAQQKYTLFAQMENYEDVDASSPKPTPDPTLLPGTLNASNTTFTVNSGNCAGTTFNYWITSSYAGFKATGSPIAGGGIPIAPLPPLPPATPTPDLGTGIVANWKFDEAPGSTTFADSSGNNLNGNTNGLSIVSSGCRFGSCLQNTNVNAWGSVPYNSLFNITQNLTYNVWAKLRAQPPSLQWPNLLGRGSHVSYGIHQREGNNGWDTYFEWGKSPCDGSLYTANFFNSNVSDGNWHMYTMTQNGSLIKTYFDGVSVGSGTTFSPFCGDTTNIMHMGGPYFTGKIDEARIYDNALTDSEVLSLYNTFPQAVVPTPPTTGLVGYWNMDDEPSWNGTANEVKDSAGTSDGTAVGGATNTTDSFLPAYGKTGSFNGTDTSVELGAGKFDSLTDATVSVWIYYTGTFTDNKVFFSKYKDSSNRLPIFVGMSSLPAPYPKKIIMELWSTNPSTESHGIFSDNPINENTWYHVAVTCGSSGMTMYVNGIKQTQVDPTTRCFQSLGSTITNSFGQHGTGDGFPFPGYIDDVRIYDRALSTAEIETIFNSNPPPTLTTNLAGYWKMDESSWNNDCSTASVTDSSGTGNNGKSCPAGIGPTGGAAGKFSNAGSFDGVEDYITMNASASLDNIPKITVSAWVKPDVTSGWPNIVSKYVYADGGWILRSSQAGNGLFTPHVYANGQWHLCSGASVPTSSWTHLTFTYDGDTLRGYVNGIETCTNTNPSGDLSSNTTTVKIGGVPGVPGEYYDGKVDDVRIYNRVLSASEVSALYAYTPPAITSDLVAHWKMDDPLWNGTSGEVKDSAGVNHGTATNATNTASGPQPIFNKSGSFNGTNAYISASTPITFPNDITVSSWIKTTTAAERPILSNRNPNGGFYYGVTTGKAFVFLNSASPQPINGTRTINDNAWHNIVFTRSGNTSSIYIDGTLDTSITQTGYVPNTDFVRIGHDVANNIEYFPGLIDDVRIYNRALTDSEIQALYVPPVACPSTGLVSHWKMDESSWNGTNGEVKDAVASNHGTAASATTTTGTFNRAGSFNGTDGYVLIPDSASFYLSNALTISAWFNPSIAVQEGGAPLITKGAGGGGEVFSLDFNHPGDDLRFYFWKGGNAYAWWVPDWLNSSKVNQWHLVTAIYDAGTVKIYVDGVSQTLSTSSPGPVPVTLDTNNHDVSIGSRQTGSGPYDFNFNGLIDDVRIYNKVLSSSEVATLNTCSP